MLEQRGQDWRPTGRKSSGSRLPDAEGHGDTRADARCRLFARAQQIRAGRLRGHSVGQYLERCVSRVPLTNDQIV